MNNQRFAKVQLMCSDGLARLRIQVDGSMHMKRNHCEKMNLRMLSTASQSLDWGTDCKCSSGYRGGQSGQRRGKSAFSRKE